MSFIHDSRPDDQHLERYLLGLLSEEDAEELDRASIEDDDVAVRLRVLEDDLIDAYVRRTLAAETRQRFESCFLSTRPRRERVAFAERFVPAVDRAAARAGMGSGEYGEDAAADAGGASDAAPPAARSTVAARLGAAAALLIAASAVAFWSTARLNDGEGVPTERAATAPAQQTPQQIDTKGPEALPSRGQAPEPPTRQPGTSPTPPRDSAEEAAIVALVLAPQTRAGGPVPVLSLPADTDRVAIELRLEPNDASRYDASLTDPGTHRAIWRSGWIAKRSSGDESSVVVVVPARLLKPQHYSLDLNARGDRGRSEVAGSYTFQVVPR